jgi:hypothetical protein
VTRHNKWVPRLRTAEAKLKDNTQNVTVNFQSVQRHIVSENVFAYSFTLLKTFT